MLNMCTKFHKNTFDSFNVIEGTRFPYNSVKITCGGINSMRNVGKILWVLFFAHHLYLLVYT